MPDVFRYVNGSLHAEGIDLHALAARAGTPLYVYSAAAMRDAFDRFAAAFADLRPLLCYALKASGNIHLCRLLAARGAGMDVVSGGELERAWLSGTPMHRVVFAGVGKTEPEIRAALDGHASPLRAVATDPSGNGPDGRGPVGLFNVESEEEFLRIARLARELGVVAEACLRVNPDVDAKTHKFTTTGRSENKFGVDIARARDFFEAHGRDSHLRLRGIHVHLGSPIASPAPYVEALGPVLALIDDLARRGLPIATLNLGGGYGVDYGQHGDDDRPASIEAFAAAIVPLLAGRVRAGLRIVMEPGRAIVADAGLLLSRVQYVKPGRERTFIIGDAGMHTLLRPALYGAYHFIWPVRVAPAFAPASRAERQPMPGLVSSDVVGPICESSDFLAQRRDLPPVRSGDLLAVFGAGAYGMSMGSTYNDHPRPAEVLVDGDRATLIRPRQDLRALIEPELTTPPPI